MMLVFAIVMLVMSLIFAAVAVQIYKGKTDLIHSYHQSKVEDKIGYGKAFAKALAIIAAAMFFSSVISLAFQAIVIAVAVMLLGLIAGLIGILIVQKKYNRGVF